MNNDIKAPSKLPAFLGLFTSFSTLICCALPALFVTLGLGGVVVGLTSSFPFLITLSLYKDWAFGISLVLLLFSAAYIYWSRNLPCPIDPVERQACQRARKISKGVTLASFTLWGIGAVVAYFPEVFL